MSFREWLKEQPRPRSEIARLLSISEAHLSRLSSVPPKSGVSLALAAKIERLTDGVIPIGYWAASEAA